MLCGALSGRENYSGLHLCWWQPGQSLTYSVYVKDCSFATPLWQMYAHVSSASHTHLYREIHTIAQMAWCTGTNTQTCTERHTQNKRAYTWLQEESLWGFNQNYKKTGNQKTQWWRGELLDSPDGHCQNDAREWESSERREETAEGGVFRCAQVCWWIHMNMFYIYICVGFVVFILGQFVIVPAEMTSKLFVVEHVLFTFIYLYCFSFPIICCAYLLCSINVWQFITIIFIKSYHKFLFSSSGQCTNIIPYSYVVSYVGIFKLIWSFLCLIFIALM